MNNTQVGDTELSIYSCALLKNLSRFRNIQESIVKNYGIEILLLLLSTENNILKIQILKCIRYLSCIGIINYFFR